ncbi:MAG: 2-hydroxyglutaryl-CoA dehydratase [Deltaproteobacteria bacterium]|nr:2-hydroxyglutaryl-CoA dehydratase [Deltaproteobacteria bacterium]MBW2082114.1 2-hydroxyglutaryl-CoA dehydratase [Deltaproteobacteria bacterium]HDM09512.1 2-hydroxyglutaryl-CoA dehydratase [Desulfobacteraceae bacterium]
MEYFAGVDTGSLSTEVVIVDQDLNILAYSIQQTGSDPIAASNAAMDDALFKAGISREQIKKIIATGYGRISVPFADKKITEISCHAMGAYHLFPDTGTVIDIGGQDSKVIQVGPEGKVLDFAMNDKCAAGTGRFLEVMASTFGLSLDQMGDLSLQAKEQIPISSMCTVFAESEVVSLIAQNKPKENIILGLHAAIVNRVWNMAQTVGIHGQVTMTGGVAKNRGVVALFEKKVSRPIHVYEEPQIIGALGAALLAARQ